MRKKKQKKTQNAKNGFVIDLLNKTDSQEPNKDEHNVASLEMICALGATPAKTPQPSLCNFFIFLFFFTVFFYVLFPPVSV